MSASDLIKKYNVPVPRYTSYPALPHWNNSLSAENWKNHFIQAYEEFGKSDGISLYIHLPYCESLCTYCGCNKRITKNHRVELPYISAIMKEWNLYLELLDEKPKLAGIHLGGGTPTFFSPISLGILLKHISRTSTRSEKFEFSFEGHPNNTSKDHLQTLAQFGFSRVSYGIQDFDQQVQVAIHRIQPFEKVKEVTEQSRQLGYRSINFDLIYGLPHQTLETMKATFQKVKELMPERIAFYSYAHLPAAFPAQKSFEAYLPDENQKRDLYEQGKNWLLEMGYEEIGMDHFALPGDPLLKAKYNNKLHRNFMGYTTSPSKILLGLGCSAISDIYYAYGQNEKSVDLYKEKIIGGTIPLVKGHVQNEANLKIKNLIMELICNHKASWKDLESLSEELLDQLLVFEKEKMVAFDANGVRITREGKPFVRNICAAFDPYMQNNKKSKPLFSKAI
ncbi:oxygen-independent coproporphyrinogen III oxidase [Cyclobacterium plantarum]|uniref:Coproporphyrinogen-III oxidase n=1 Tax=Cyclobacterium plantarum TaxID=2716263 RepID=A0ABX0H8G5_9BACT|nr:oxygen-independent coproporphyrinogen III oxidase [Cyclobacterium plantarum]NHE57670.1 oxygen-independent coproporphyrinogen III oxidase [Cyclobacterium plantarum]